MTRLKNTMIHLTNMTYEFLSFLLAGAGLGLGFWGVLVIASAFQGP